MISEKRIPCDGALSRRMSARLSLRLVLWCRYSWGRDRQLPGGADRRREGSGKRRAGNRYKEVVVVDR
jgi:hypothetical protein